jgi:hypothetical protein
VQVLLVHGLGRTPASLTLLATRLGIRGYDPHMFGYFAATEDFDSIANRLRIRMQELNEEGPLCLVTHSLGGLLARAALHNTKVDARHIVMLAPPNRLPRMATWAVRQPLFKWFSRDSGEKLADEAFFHNLPLLKIPYTIIAGDYGVTIGPLAGEPNDGVVAVSETRMRDEDDILIVPGMHTFIMNRSDVADLVFSAIGPPLNPLVPSLEE